MDRIEQNEIRIVMQSKYASAGPARGVPALLFKKLFDAVLAALVAADREIHTKRAASEFFVVHFSATGCEFGFAEKTSGPGVGAAPALALLRRCAARVYRSDYQILLQYPRLMRAFHRIVAALDPAYDVVVRYHDTELPLDEFFRRQVDRVGLRDRARPLTERWFAGVVVTSFDGRLETIDYHGSAWTGRLTLAGGETQIECVFDKSLGEDALNPFGNKDVSVTGRAIHTGDSQLPERLEVLRIEVLPRLTAAIDIRGALAPAEIGEWEDGLDHFNKR